MTDLPVLEHQADLLESTAPLVCDVAGLGSGKTYGAALKVVQLAQTNPGLPGMWVLPTFPMLRDIARPTLLEVFRKLGLQYEEQKAGWNFLVRLGGGLTELRLRSAQHPDRLQGSNLAWAIIDEAGQVSDDAFTAVSARVRHPDAALHQRVLIGTPEGMQGFFYREAEEKRQPSTQVIRAKTTDNPFLPSTYVQDNLGHLSEAELAQYVEGLFVPSGGRVYRFDRSRNLAELPNMAGDLYMGADFNVGKMVWLPARHVRGQGELHFFEELVGANTNTQEHAQRAREWWADRGVPASAVTVVCDATGAARRSSSTTTDVLLLRQAGFKVKHRSRNPPVKDRIASVNKMLTEGRLLVDPGSRELLRALEQQGYDSSGEPDKASGLDHAADAAGYLVHLLAPVKAPKGGSNKWH